MVVVMVNHSQRARRVRQRTDEHEEGREEVFHTLSQATTTATNDPPHRIR